METIVADTIPQELIQLIEQTSSYQEAIQVASQPLIDQGYIEASYVQRMLDSITTFGPYIIVADEFALPHAHPGDGVHQTALSLLLMHQPVDLLGHPVRVMIVVAASNSTDHMERLEALAPFLMEPQHLTTLKSCTTQQQVHHYLQERWNQ